MFTGSVWNERTGVLRIDGVRYPMMAVSGIAPGFAEVDVDLDDHGVELKAALFSGLVGSTIGDSGVAGKAGGQWDELRPAVGWAFFTIDENTPRKERKPEWWEGASPVDRDKP